MTPLSVLRIWIVGLLSLAIVGGGAYLLWEWYEGWQRYSVNNERPVHWYLYEPRYLWGGLALLGVSFLGRWLVMPFLGMGGGGEPRLTRDGASQRLKRPDGTELYVEMHGPADAPPVVLIHGWSLDSRAWYYARRELAGRFRLITWDLRGMGQSSRPRTNYYSLEQMAGDLEAVIGLAGARPVSLVGHSIGGMVIQEFCQRFPKSLGTRVSRIVLVDTTYTNPLRTTILRKLAQAIQKPVIEPLMHLTVWTSPLVWLMNLQSYQNGTMHLTTRLSSFAGSQTWRQVDVAARLSALQSPAVTARGMLAMLRFDAQPALPQINVPVLVVHGKNDRPLRIDAGEHLSRTVPGARLVTLEPAGHLGILEQHDEFDGVVKAFLEERRKQTHAASAG